MSVTLSQADQEAVNAFKACFGIKADPIRGAYEDAVRLPKQIEAKKKEQGEVAKLRDSAEKVAAEMLAKREKIQAEKGKMPNESSRETTARENATEYKARLETLKTEVGDLEEKLRSAGLRKSLDPWAEYLKQLKSLKQRLADAGQDESKIDADSWNGPVASFDAGKFKEFEEAVRKQSRDVEALCAPIELGKKRDAVERRLSALEKLDYKDAGRIGAIRADAKTAEAAKLDDEIEEALAELEDDCERFPDRVEEAEQAVGALRDEKSLPAGDIEQAGKTLLKLRTAARKLLSSDLLAEMEAFEDRLDFLQERSDKAAEQRDRYEQEAKEAREEAAEFLERSGFHKSYGLALNNKVLPALSDGERLADMRNFVAAAQAVEGARTNLAAWDASAWKNEKNQKNVKLLQDQQAQKRRNEEENKKKLEEAKNRDDVAALNLITKKEFGPWLAKVGKLCNGGLIGVAVSDPIGLNGKTATIEIIVTLSKLDDDEPDLEDNTFVVHYHPHKMKKNAGLTKKEAAYQVAKNSSPFHIKPDKFSKTRASVGDWLEPRLPTVQRMKDFKVS